MIKQFYGEEFVNLAICIGSDSRGTFCPLIADSIVDLHFAGGVATQCFPLFLYEPCDDIGQADLFGGAA